MKRSKSGEHETDITQYIGTLEVSEQDGALTVVFTANAADGRYLNPVYIAKAIAEKLGFNEPVFGYAKEAYAFRRNRDEITFPRYFNSSRASVRMDGRLFCAAALIFESAEMLFRFTS